MCIRVLLGSLTKAVEGIVELTFPDDQKIILPLVFGEDQVGFVFLGALDV